ncbi:MAG: hypothetical protein ABSF98_10230 [Bryobacteraceae bacterium]|jgi:hypothetical protein
MTLDDATALLRFSRNLRALETEEEGFALPALPAGIYGFTYSPNFEETPLFGTKTFQAFEFHKLTDGAVELVGYMTAADADRFGSGEAGVEVHLYPDAWKDAQQLVSVPMARIVRSKQRPARDSGCPYKLRLE